MKRMTVIVLCLLLLAGAGGCAKDTYVIGSPDINEVILPGDLLMTIGNRDQTKSLENMCKL